MLDVRVANRLDQQMHPIVQPGLGQVLMIEVVHQVFVEHGSVARKLRNYQIIVGFVKTFF